MHELLYLVFYWNHRLLFIEIVVKLYNIVDNIYLVCIIMFAHHHHYCYNASFLADKFKHLLLSADLKLGTE
jgi:hypothetical protein